MKNVPFWKKLKFYLHYRKVILGNKKEFENKYNLRVDRVNRIYTVINIPENIFGEPYNLRTSDINKISEPYISEFTKQVSILLNEKGLSELYRMYDMTKIDKYSYLVIIGFSLFDTSKVARNIYLRILPTVIITSLLYFIFLKF